MGMEMEFAYQGTIVGPPTDDVCPICFDEFTAPCMTSCRHWFCADCILKYWYYRGGIRKCKCPKCNGDIHKLKVEASLFVQDDEQNVKILERVMHYNRLYAGGWQFFSMVGFLATRQLQKKSKRYPGLSNDGCWKKVLYFVFAV